VTKCIPSLNTSKDVKCMQNEIKCFIPFRIIRNEREMSFPFLLTESDYCKIKTACIEVNQ
jgi:hypothetical protein